MFNTFKYTTLSLLRHGGVLVWALAFPIVLSTCFLFMFGSLDDMGKIDSIKTIVVEDQAFNDSPAFSMFINALDAENDSSEESFLDITRTNNAEEAANLLTESQSDDEPFAGYVMLDKNGEPEVHVPSITDTSNMTKVYSSILVTLMDTFKSRSGMMQEIVTQDPTKLANGNMIKALYGNEDPTTKIELTVNPPKESVRYYFALLGMATLFGAQVSLIAVLGLLPNMGALGSRRAISGTSHARALAGTLLASWVVSFACLFIAYFYIRFVCNVDFAGRDGACLLVMAVSSLMATSLGAAIAAIPKMANQGKVGLLTCIACLAALFSGLYGSPTMKLADTVAKAFPPSELINPAVQISQALYSLMYYDSFVPTLAHLGVLLLMTIVLFALSARSLKKVRYASI